MVRKTPASELPWRLHFFQRHQDDDALMAVPGQDFLLSCPTAVRAKLLATLKAVVEAPPPSFGGGGKWEAMHADMAGYFEARVDGPQRHHYRVFCLLERNGAELGIGGPSLIVITGRDKPFQTVLSAKDYAAVRALGDEYKKRRPRSVLK